MLTTLLDLSRLEAGAIQPETADFDAAPLLRRIAAEFEAGCLAKGIALRVEVGSAPVASDRILLGRIVSNLLSNAVRYTDSGGVTLRSRLRGTRVVIEVEDTGLGIPESERLRIFEAFVRLHERKIEDGLGLGLSIVERLSQLLGCEVTLDSEPGSGSTFAVSVPRAPENALEEGTTPARVDPGTELEGQRILLIDDDAAVREAMQALLERWGCVVLAAADSDAAMEMLLAESERPDALISDYRLGSDATGIEAIVRIRAVVGTGLPAVVITGETTPASRERIRAAGLRWLTKPVPPHKLRAILRELLRD